ncbi:MAG: hypothetical protein ACREQJ_16905, partial [Candidatus Binatia bacterium]
MKRSVLVLAALIGTVVAPIGAGANVLFQGEEFGGEIYGSLTQHLGFGLHRSGETSKAPNEEPDRRNSRVLGGGKNQTDMPGLHYAYTALNLDMSFHYGEHWKA